MFCSNCGIELKEESKFCHSCGTDSTVMPVDDSKNTEEELSRNKELLLRHLMGDLNPNEKKVVAELLRSNDWARDFLNEAAENAHAPRADIPDSTKKILQQQKEIKEKRAKIIGLSLIPKSTVKKISQESKENSEIDSDQPQKEEVIDTASLEEQDESRTLELTGKEVKPSHVENTDEVKDGEESVEVVSAEPKDPKCICNHCNQHIAFDESMSGAVIQCPGCGMDTELYIHIKTKIDKTDDKHKKETVTLQGAEKQSTEFTENQMKITHAYGAIEGVMRKGINAVKQKAKFVSVFIVSVLIISLVFLFVNRESAAEKRQAFGGHVVGSYGMIRNVTENSFDRIGLFLENWSAIGTEKLEKFARENPPQKLDGVSHFMDKLRSRKEVDLEMYNSVIELHDISLAIWKLSKSPAGDNQRTYASKAVKLQKKFEPIEARVRRLYDSKKFNSSGISLNQANEILKKISNNK